MVCLCFPPPTSGLLPPTPLRLTEAPCLPALSPSGRTLPRAAWVPELCPCSLEAGPGSGFCVSHRGHQGCWN